MRTLIKSIARSLGYEIRKIPPALPADIQHFLNRPEGAIEFDYVADTAACFPQMKNAGAPHSSQHQTTLIVEGWRLLPHSYAIVNQWQLLALSRRPDVAFKIRDLPFYGRHWRPEEGLFNPEDESLLKSFEIAGQDAHADVTMRVGFPFDFSPSKSAVTAVFGTSEHQMVLADQLQNVAAYEALQATQAPTNIKVLTPSRWSAEGFLNTGLKPEQIHIVPHGVNVDIYHPMPTLRRHIRSKLSIADSDFVFLSVGAMTGNKGMDLLLRAFSEVCRKYPNARLILKGMDPIYKSKTLLQKSLQLVPAANRKRLLERMTYFGQPLPNWKMAMLYQCADAYVSPYRAEGFNIPVLEAAACGVPVVCTRGGPTDDFTTDGFARRIDSAKVPARYKDQDVWHLKPDLDHLITLMSEIIENESWCRQAALLGPAHVRAHFTWDLVVDLLLRKLSII